MINRPEEVTRRKCYYTYGNACPGLMAPGGRHVLMRCTRCKEFNGNLGKVTVNAGKGLCKGKG